MSALVIPIVGKGISKSFRRETGEAVRALDDLSFEARRTTLTALVGPDGAGKTTLIRLTAGLMTPDAGTLSVLGIDVAAHPQEVQDRIGYMPQKFGLYEDLSVQENLDLYADLHGAGAVPIPARGAVVRRHEAEAWPRVHAGAIARVAVARRTDRRGRPPVAARIVGDHPASRP
jgi:ABC-type multidrug transport system ATPase subunit